MIYLFERGKEGKERKTVVYKTHQHKFLFNIRMVISYIYD